MPARSNAFQRLVRAIQGHLSRTGTVKESRMLPDKDTGSLVEVDIVIEETVGGHSVLVGVECTAEKRKATIEWYREMRGKHADLPIDKTVLVSKSGFTREVFRKARKDNVVLMMPGEAQAFNWSVLFTKLKGGTVADVQFRLRSVSIVAQENSSFIGQDSVTLETLVHLQNTQRSIGQLAIDVARENGLTRNIMANLRQVMEKTDYFSFGFRLPAQFWIAVNGSEVSVIEIKATMSIHPRYQDVDWNPIDVNGHTVAAGTFPAEFLFPGSMGDTVVTASRKTGDDFKVTLLGPHDEDVELEVFPHALWQSNNPPRD